MRSGNVTNPLPAASHSFADGIGTDKWGETMVTPGARYVANKVSKGDQVSGANFDGYADVWAAADGRVFATNVCCVTGQAWPRIAEGSSEPLYATPGYPVTVDEYVNHAGPLRLCYSGQWVDRTHGPPALNAARQLQGLQNGAYVWLDDKRQHNVWPYRIEINVWNTHCGKFPDEALQFTEQYYDTDGVYNVAWRDNFPFSGGSFRAYYFYLNGPHKSSMSLDMKALYRFLKQTHSLDGSYYIVETDIAVEAHPGGDGKFIAQIESMGRPV